MPELTQARLAEALTEVIRDALTRGEDLTIPGLGTFSIQHHPSQVVEDGPGKVVIRPPHNEIRFVPATD